MQLQVQLQQRQAENYQQGLSTYYSLVQQIQQLQGQLQQVSTSLVGGGGLSLGLGTSIGISTGGTNIINNGTNGYTRPGLNTGRGGLRQ